MEALRTTIQISGYLIIFISFLPLIRSDYWFFRVFEYPRLQKFILNITLLVAFTGLFTVNSWNDVVFCSALSVNLLYLSYQIFPFTIFAKKHLIRPVKSNPERCISLFIGNIYQYNREASKYLEHLKRIDPDVIMLVETDQWWNDQLKPISKTHPYSLKAPLNNTYGMILYSKLELIKGEIKYLVEDDIPSVHTRIKLPSGELIQFYGLHPTPPVPGENPRSTERDKEILLVAKEAKKSKIPVIVAGDLNDVAWSYTTELFSKISGLLDPRKGRGFFNTFHAKYPILRFPLDHIFCSTDFSLVHIKRMPTYGSDHFPMFVKLQIDPKAENENEKPTPDLEDVETADKKLAKAT